MPTLPPLASACSDPVSYLRVREERVPGFGAIPIYRFAEHLESVHRPVSTHSVRCAAEPPRRTLPDLRPALLRHAECRCHEALGEFTAQLVHVPHGTGENWGFEGGGPLFVTLLQIEAYVQEQDRLRLRICCEWPRQPLVDELKARWARQMAEQGSEAANPPAQEAMRADLALLLRSLFKNEAWGEVALFSGRNGDEGAHGLAMKARDALSADPSLNLDGRCWFQTFGPGKWEEQKQTRFARGVLNSAIADRIKVDTLIELMKGALVAFALPR